MSIPTPSRVSFMVRRPTPESRATSTGPDSVDAPFKLPALPRHLAQDHSANSSTPGSPLAGNSPKRSAPVSPDSSDEEYEQPTDELVTGFDRFGVQRATPRQEPQGPLVIPALQNRDWRELARRRRGGANGMYVPPSGQAGTGTDGSVGGLGTREVINSGPQVEGLQMRKRVRVDTVKLEESIVAEDNPEETEDQRAIRALLASAQGGDGPGGPMIDIIPMANDSSTRRAPTEDDAFKQDVDELPDQATLNDYERIPVSQFGAALLRGMGWKPGEPASRNRNRGIVEPWLPASRPALLGIGAKEREVFDDGSSGRRAPSRPERKYIPLVRKESERSPSPRTQPGSRSESRRSSRSPPQKERREDDRDRRRDRDRDREPERERERDRDGHRGRDRELEGERDRRRDRSPRSSRRDRDRRDH